MAVNDSYTVDEDSTISTVAGMTSLQMTSQPGDYIGQSRTNSFTPANASFTASNGTNTVRDIMTSATDHLTFSFAAPAGQPLVADAYAGVMRFGFQTGNHPGLDVSGDSRGSNTVTGQSTVEQVAFDPGGKTRSFAVSFEQHSEGSPPTLTGQVLYNATLAGLPGVLVNDNDPDNDALTARVVAMPAHGRIGLHADGSLGYTPSPGFSGTDQLTYKSNDGQLDSNLATATLTVNQNRVVDDPGFEAVAVGSGHAYNPTGSAWTFGCGAEFAGNGSDFTTGNPPAPEGGQVGFIQGTGTITQTISGWVAATYSVTFQAAQRGNHQCSAEDFQVLVDGAVVATFRPTGTSDQSYTTSSFKVRPGRTRSSSLA